MANWTKPALDGSDLDLSILSYIDARLNDLAKMFSTAPSNQPDGTIKYDAATNAFYKYDLGTTSWVALNLAVAGGGTGSGTASGARTNLGLGSMAVQESNNVSITGGAVAGAILTGGPIPAAVLGTGTPSASTVLYGNNVWGPSVPVGSGNIWFTSVAPTGYLLCDGSAILRATYSALFSVIGTVWGAGNGSTTFNLPDLRGKFPVGYLGAITLALSGGTWDHTHAYTQVLQHTHPIVLTDPGHLHGHGWDNTSGGDHVSGGSAGQPDRVLR